jgi:sugar/nucleoside kinase (ribokinase family)
MNTSSANIDSTLARATAKKLRDGGARLEQTPSLLGFDGFIDTIYHVVDQRQSASEYSRVHTLAEYGGRIVAAAGKSTNVEIVPQNVKLGGNGPIMANAMCALGVPITYCGMTGYPTLNEVFRELADRAQLLPICDPALTDAVEFDDGKLIVGKHATVAQVSYETLVERVGEATWREAWQAARFVAMVNWTMLPYLTELWQKIQVEFPGGERKVMFFDLADPEKRTRSDIREALLTLAKFQEQHDVLMGLNEKEAQHVADVLELEVGNDDDLSREQNMIDLASNIREKLGIAVCVVHPTQFAAAANIQTTAVAAGPFTPNPKISTGAGDHFNAGFCTGYLLGCDLAQSLQMGVATSGYYVRNAQSPTREQLADFLDSLEGPR